MKRIVAAAELLCNFPELGSPVEHAGDPDVRETYIGSYRLVYRYRRPTIEVLAVRHGTMTRGEEDLFSE